MDISQRHRQPELMDQPNLSASEHERALRGLRRVNWLSDSSGILWKPICREALRKSRVVERRQGALRVLDLACGGGDVLVRLARRAKRHGLIVEWLGCDLSPVALATANRLAERSGLSTLRFQQLDALGSPLPEGFDVIMCSLFLHHLDEPDAVDLLRKMAAAAATAVLVNDLRRTQFGYWLAAIGTRLLTRSPIVHFDGPISVAGAWTCEEVRRLAQQAGLLNIEISAHFPERFLLQWRRA